MFLKNGNLHHRLFIISQCYEGSNQNKGCFNEKHQTVEYLNIKAKFYFFQKPIKNLRVCVKLVI